jgi:hypothetical protein
MTKKIEILACAIALLAVSPAAGFGQHADALDFGRAENGETELGDVGSSVSVTRMLVAKDVSDREPVDTASEFSIAATTHLFAFFELSNLGEEQTVTVSFIDVATDRTVQSYDLKVGASKRWRTWARTTAPRQPGAWTVVLTDRDGNELRRADFKMVE